MKKDNIFEHILYEIDMYLSTYDLFNTQYKEAKLDDVEYCYVRNAIFESHFLHMRNVKDLFLNNKSFPTDIVLSTVLLDPVSCTISKEDLVCKDENGEIIYDMNHSELTYAIIMNKSIEHLTKERFDSSLTSTGSLDALQMLSMQNMMKLLIPNIKAFSVLVSNKANIVAEYQNAWDVFKEKIDFFSSQTIPTFSTTFGFD